MSQLVYHISQINVPTFFRGYLFISCCAAWTAVCRYGYYGPTCNTRCWSWCVPGITKCVRNGKCFKAGRAGVVWGTPSVTCHCTLCSLQFYTVTACLHFEQCLHCGSCPLERTSAWHSLTALQSWWRRGVVVSIVGSINEVNRHRARLVLGWVTVCGRVNHLGM